MPETALIPYRIQAPMQIEPIDLALVPDCGRSEKTRLEKEIDTTKSGLAVYKDRVCKKAFRKIFPATFGLTATICVYVGYAYSAGPVVVCALIGLYLSLQVAGALSENIGEKWLPDNEEARLLEVRSVDQKQRLEKLESLMRLTGIEGECSRKLQAEIQSFNADFDRLVDVDECTNDERTLILKRRREIVSRINDFRQKSLEPPHEPPLLTAGPDDRT